MTKTFLAAALLCVGGTLAVGAQRPISSFKEITIQSGGSTEIGGIERTEPDIYYLPQNDGTFEAVRLTVTPPSTMSAMTVPYLNMNTSTSICVNWKTSRKTNNAVVKFGLSADNLDRTCEASTRMIAAGYHWNTAALEGLTPNTVYYYKVESDGKESDTYRFRTIPEPGDKSKLRVLFIGDHQRNEHSDYEWLLNAARQTVKEKYGDAPFEDYISFLMNDGDQVDGGYIDLYEKVHLFKSRSVSPTLANMTAVGNHEYSNDPELKLYKNHFKEYGDLDYKGIKSNDAGYYAYQVGRVLFVVLNSDNPTAVQKMWVRKVIAAASTDTTVDFIVSVQHRPLYAEQWSSDVSAWMMNEIMPILSSTPKHVLNCAGHHHLYARGQMTDTPVYHIISGGGVGTTQEGYEQLWGKAPECYNHDEVQCTIDQWTYQILEFDPQTKEMKVDCYAIGNSRLAVDNELVDSFSRRIGYDPIDDTPVLGSVEEVVTLPYTFTQNADIEVPYASQYQISADPDFKNLVLDKVVTCQDFYGVTDDFRPLDLNAGKRLKEFTVENGSLVNGTYYMRVRNRNSNLNWSEFSEPVKFTVEGASDPTALVLDHKFYHTGSNVKVSYTGAPVGTNAWIGIYREHHTPGTSDLSYKYAYTSGNNGSCDFTINDQGAFFAVLFKDDGYTEISGRCFFVVNDKCDDINPPAISLDKQTYGNEEPVVLKLSNAPCIPKDWVGVYTADVSKLTSSHSIHYAYVRSNPDGEVVLNVKENINYKGPLADGCYFATYCIADNYYEPTERAYFIVGKPVQVEALATEIELGNSARVLFEGVPTWIGEARLCVYKDAVLCSYIPVEETGAVVEVPVETIGNYTACVAVADGSEISPRVGFSVVDPSGGSGVELIGETGNGSLHISANGEIVAEGEINVYTPSGVLYANGKGRVCLSVPGIYIVRTSTNAARVAMR